MTLKLERSCWWCGTKLMAVSHATIKDKEDREYQVHKICETAARNYLNGMSPLQRSEIQEGRAFDPEKLE